MTIKSSLTRSCLFAAGAMLLLCTAAPWGLGYFMIIATGSGETVSLRETGMVTCPEVLTWSPWKNGSGAITQGQLAERIPADAEIIAHRIGINSRMFAELTHYQAKYRLPDGRIETAPADGPKALVSVNRESAMTWSALALFSGIACLFFATRVHLRMHRDGGGVN
ncbi:MAG: hypothetical protein WKF77_18765 [Planctomycetaceae bacterium]